MMDAGQWESFFHVLKWVALFAIGYLLTRKKNEEVSDNADNKN